jgi:uncharacterized iron-regulated membrane protein
VGLPRHLFGPAPESSPPLTNLGDVPWALTHMRLPESVPPDASHRGPSLDPGHPGHEPDVLQAAGTPPITPAPAAASSIGLNEALRIFGQLGLPPGTPVSLPAGARGVYTAMLFPDDVRDQRIVHLDRYTGAVLADAGYADYGVAGRLTQWGVNLHTGVQFGWINKLVMLAGCLATMALTVSAAVMWWKRRPPGRLAAPPRLPGDRVTPGIVAVAMVLGLLYPLLGASMLVAMLIDTVVPDRWHERCGL